ncbi:hemin uptake protein HemP [Thorsellia kenyensis]|uniref:Hemin uptake protein HemP n=1 Tax=Thorsellia kenyensis TaxID=1549888 RepID=A0ABV6CA27_9GAMM
MTQHSAKDETINKTSLGTQQDAKQTKIIDSDSLFESNKIVYIQHQNGLYQLRETKAGKLILTK